MAACLPILANHLPSVVSSSTTPSRFAVHKHHAHSGTKIPSNTNRFSTAPRKGLCTNRAFRKHEVIATFGSSDVRLRLLLTQYRRLPFPAATAALLPYTCHCGTTHMKLQATDDVSDNAILLIGEASNWQGCLVQFDGSAHKRTQTGGAGICLLQITQEATTLVRWKSIPLIPCADNVIAEAKACLAAVHLANEYHGQCLARGISQEGIVIQGDILPLLNYLLFFHEYGRRVGMVPRSSLKGGKNSLMVEKRTRRPNTTQTKQPKAHRPSLHHHVVFPLC